MAIIIPSKNIYGKQNPKVRDNVIERIEVGAVEVVRDNDYNTPVYNGVFPQVDTVIENKSGDEDYEAETSYAYEIWTAHVAYISYINQRFFYKNIYIKKTQNNHFVQSIILGQNEEGQNNIKHTVYGYTQSGVATAEWEGKYKATGTQGTLNLNIGTINFGNPTVNNKIVAFNLFEEYTFNWENDIPTDSTIVSVSRTAQDYSNLGEIYFSEEEIDGEEYYKLSLSIMCGYRRVTMGAYNSGNTYTEEGKERTFSMKGNYIDYIPTQIEITIYGDSIGIDLVDKTVYINGETAKKVHRIDGNELIQTITEKQIELKQLNKGTDYVWEYYIDPISGGVVYSRAELYIYNNDLIGAVVVVSIEGSGGVLNKEFEVPSNKTIGIDNGGYPIDDISSVSVKVLKEINNIDGIFNKIALAYKDGKETATIRCSISDYYEYDSGDKIISVDNSTSKMSFSIGDQVVPMVYGANKQDTPMSKSNNKAKIFEVLGTKIFYDGAVWQELSLQETTETIELPEEQVQLITPIVTISGDILTISNVDANTQSYTLYVDNLRTATFYDTTFDLATLNLAVGAYSISVVATTTAENYKDSEKSISVKYFVEKVVETLKTPVIAIDGDILTVSQADERTEIFAIFVDGVEKGMTTEYSFDLSTLDLAEGVYSITVIARAEEYTDSYGSNEVTYVVIAEEEEKTLSAPTITLNGNALTITTTDDRTEQFAILVDGVETIVVEAKEEEPDIPTEGLAYTLSSDGTFYTCTGIGTATDTDIVIASEYDGLPVKEIGISAFNDNENITSVAIPSSVTTIGEGAFNRCNSLTSVYITDIVAWCNISFGNSYANPLYYAKNLYLNNQLVTDLVIPDSVTSIGWYAFSHCESLTNVVIPDSVTSIGRESFAYCNGLMSVEIGGNVGVIGASSFYWCDSLTSITFNGTVAQWNEIGKGNNWDYRVSVTYVQCTDGTVSI